MSGTALAAGAFRMDIPLKNRWLAPFRSQTECPVNDKSHANGTFAWLSFCHVCSSESVRERKPFKADRVPLVTSHPD